jgi:lipid-A-disaccharide synthase
MFVAGEASGDGLAAELVEAIKTSPHFSAAQCPPEFFGAGGPQMAGAGVELAIDLTQHAVFGISDVLVQYPKFKAFFKKLLRLAVERQPDAIILVDYSGFNRRFAHAVKKHVRAQSKPFHNWNPKIIYFVSPQVWASRESRAYSMARDVDLLLSIFPFEQAWYAARLPKFRVEFVGHPMIDRYSRLEPDGRLSPTTSPKPEDNLVKIGDAPIDSSRAQSLSPPLILLLPGSRKREIEAHLPVMLEAMRQIKARQSVRMRLVLSNAEAVSWARPCLPPGSDLEIQSGQLAPSLAKADLAIASSGTVTLECAYFRVPTVVMYKTSWLTYLIARQIVKVRFIAMPNILADEAVYPEFIQNSATPGIIAAEAIDLLNNSDRRRLVKAKLSKVIDSLGGPGASARAAEAIFRLF